MSISWQKPTELVNREKKEPKSHNGWFRIQICGSVQYPAQQALSLVLELGPGCLLACGSLLIPQLSNCHLCSGNSSSSFLSNCKKVLVISYKMLLSFGVWMGSAEVAALTAFGSNMAICCLTKKGLFGFTFPKMGTWCEQLVELPA